MSNIKFSQLPNQGVPTDSTILPTVASGVNYTVTGANLKTYVNSTTGNVTAAYFIGNGSQLTGITTNYSNSNVTSLLGSFGSNAISTTGNVTAGYLIGNGSLLTNLPAGNYSNANVTALLGSFGSNAISTTGNVTSGYLFANISGATGGYGNANVQIVLQTYSGTMTAGTISTTGNITAPYFVGNGSALTGITASLGGTMVSNISGANTYSINNLVNLSASGNVVGSFVGNGAALTNVVTAVAAGAGISLNASSGVVTITNNNPTVYGNSQVAAYLPTYSGNLAGGNLSVTGTTTLSGALNSTGPITTSGTITGGNIVGTTYAGNGAGLANIVTSITAGPGISVNSSTGAVTISSTGNGTGNSTAISTGNTFVNTNGSGGFGTSGILWLGKNVTPSAFNWANNAIIIQQNTTPVNSVIALGTDGNIGITANTGSYTNISGSTNINGTLYVNIGSSSLTVNSNSATFGVPISAGNVTGQNFYTTNFTLASVANTAPATSTSTGTPGQMLWNTVSGTTYLYICVATNTWRRVAMSTF